MTSRLKNEKFLSRSDVAERYGITPRTLRNWSAKHSNFPVPVKLNGRDYWSDYDLSKWESQYGGLDPDLEGRLIGLKPVSGVISTYEQLVDAMVTRRVDLGISSMELDARAGMQEGYASKLENFGRPQGRGLGPELFPLWLGGLRVGVILVDMPRRPRKSKGEKQL